MENEIAQAVAALREAAPQATAAYIRYVWASGIAMMVWSVLAAIPLSVGAVYFGRQSHTKDSGWIMVSILCGLLLIIVSVTFTRGLVAVLAPEGAAIANIIRGLRG